MALLFRKIRVESWRDEDPAWVSPTETIADRLYDLKTKKGTLSFYRVSDDLSDLVRIASAIAMTANEFQHVHYILIDDELLRQDGIMLSSAPQAGTTPDKVVNDKHIDVEELTGSGLAIVARIMQKGRKRLDFVSQEEIRKTCVQLVKLGEIQVKKITQPSIKKTLEELLITGTE